MHISTKDRPHGDAIKADDVVEATGGSHMNYATPEITVPRKFVKVKRRLPAEGAQSAEPSLNFEP
jgi:hypothetical protein